MPVVKARKSSLVSCRTLEILIIIVWFYFSSLECMFALMFFIGVIIYIALNVEVLRKESYITYEML